MPVIGGGELRGNAKPEQFAATPVHQVINPLTPKIERGSFLKVVAVPIVDGRHTRLDVIQNLRHYEAGYASADHQTRGRTSQIVSPEINV